MSWDTVTTDDIMAEFNTDEAAAYKNMQDDGDGLASVLANVTKSVRGKIKSGGGQLGPDGTLPNSLITEVVSIVIWRWIAAFTKNEKLQTDGRFSLYKDANVTLRDIAKGELKVELPDPTNPADTDTSASPVNAVGIIRPGRRVRTSQFDMGGTT